MLVDVLGVSGRAMLDALLRGTSDDEANPFANLGYWGDGDRKFWWLVAQDGRISLLGIEAVPRSALRQVVYRPTVGRSWRTTAGESS